jgi:hypothetical protein
LRLIATAVGRGTLVGRGKNKTEAKADLERQIDWASEYHSPHIERRFYYMIVVAANAAGWLSTVFYYDMGHGDGRYCWTMAGQEDGHAIDCS